MKRISPKYFLLFVVLLFIGCKEQAADLSENEIPHYARKDNFTVLRVIIMNQNNEVLLVNDQGYWGMPWVNLTSRQFLNEAIDSMALECGVKLSAKELRGQFGFKYDYKPNVTFRNYYVATYEGGDIKVPKNNLEAKFEGIEWVDISTAIKRNENIGIKEITKKILYNPEHIWGASFMVSHTDTDHPTKLVEDFYSIGELRKGEFNK